MHTRHIIKRFSAQFLSVLTAAAMVTGFSLPALSVPRMAQANPGGPACQEKLLFTFEKKKGITIFNFAGNVVHSQSGKRSAVLNRPVRVNAPAHWHIQSVRYQASKKHRLAAHILGPNDTVIRQLYFSRSQSGTNERVNLPGTNARAILFPQINHRANTSFFATFCRIPAPAPKPPVVTPTPKPTVTPVPKPPHAAPTPIVKKPSPLPFARAQAVIFQDQAAWSLTPAFLEQTAGFQAQATAHDITSSLEAFGTQSQQGASGTPHQTQVVRGNAQAQSPPALFPATTGFEHIIKQLTEVTVENIFTF